MRRILWAIAGLAYLMIAFLAYVYLGPPQHTQFFTKSAFFRVSVAPLLDPIFNPEQGGSMIAEVKSLKGSLRFRSEKALVFRRGRISQRLMDRTFVSTSNDSEATLELFDGSKLLVGPNSMVFLERASPDNSQQIAASIKVIRGQLNVEQNAASKEKIVLENSFGQQSLIAKSTEVFRADEAINSKLEEVKVETEVLSRSLSSNSSVAERIIDPQEIIRRQQQRRIDALASKTPAIINSARPPVFDRTPSSIPPSNDITLAVRNAKQGRFLKAKQHMANSLTKREYVSAERLTTGARFALDVMLGAHLKNSRCREAKDLLSNVNTAYPSDGDASYWSNNWKDSFERRGCGRWL
ncbi:FecR domain-containing protein [bacterium]|nr:FecR domain-containing protein [bacterium]